MCVSWDLLEPTGGCEPFTPRNSILFEDPDGIRLEINHVPGKGLLADEKK